VPDVAAQGSETPLDVRGAAEALRRSAPLVVGVAALVTLITLVASLVAPERYRATARIAEDPASAATSDPATLDRRLATSRELVTAPTVLAAAATRVGGETPASLAAKVSVDVQPGAGLLDVVATAGDAGRAARIANTVAERFLAEGERLQTERLSRATARVADQLERLRGRGSADPTVAALRERLGEQTVDEATSGSGLELAERATPPDGPYAPRPLRSALLALFAALFAGLLIALARDRMRPRPPDAPELSEILGLPLLAALPEERSTGLRLPGRPPPDQAVIETAVLQASVRVALPPRSRRIVLVQGAGRRPGAGRVAADLTRSLCWAGHAAVLVASHPTAEDIPVVRRIDALEDSDAADVRYAIVDGPPMTHGTALQTLAPQVTAVILVMRLGHVSVGDAAAARRLLGALGMKGLGLVVTCSPAQAREIPPEAFAFPERPGSRPRSPSRNGASSDKRPSNVPGDERPIAAP
jgi:capsular polysaccharide biosynthesis protein